MGSRGQELCDDRLERPVCNSTFYILSRFSIEPYYRALFFKTKKIPGRNFPKNFLGGNMQSLINCGVMAFAALFIVITAVYAFLELTAHEYDYPKGYLAGALSVGWAYVIYKILTALPH